MLGIAFLMTGCVSPPSSIPDAPGTLSEDNVDLAMTVAVPDAPYALWSMLLTLAEEQFRACPQVLPTQTGVNYVGGGCVDSAGVTWLGNATYTEGSGGGFAITLNDFGYAGVVPGEWTAKGQILGSRTPDYSGYVLDTRLAVTSTGALTGEESLDYWFDTVGAYTSEYSDFGPYADNYSGEVGVGGLGMFDLVGRRTLVGAYGCSYGAAGFGEIALGGTNRADFVFHAEAQKVAAPPPAYYDTGFPIDTGDTGETGDSGDSGSDDTGGGGSGSDEEDDEVLCGCANATLAQTDGSGASVVSECMLPGRTLAPPFVGLY